MEKRNTMQKKLILDAVFHLKNHPTADDVYQFILSAHPNISKATVYRNLAGLAKDNQIRHIQVFDGADRFDYNYEKPHNHIMCTHCGAFCDAPALNTNEIDEFVAQNTNYKNVRHEIILTGVCPVCLNSA